MAIAPASISTTTVETLSDLLSDGLFVDGDWIESKDQDPAGDVRLIQLADVGDGYFRDRSARFLTIEKARELQCTFLEPGDVLIARMPEPLGRACLFPGFDQPAVTAVDVCIARPNRTRVSAEWLVKAINLPAMRASMQQFVRGTTRERISRRNLGRLTLAVPPLNQQLEIARLLEDVEIARNSALQRIQESNRIVGRLRDAVLESACSGRLTEDWRGEDGESSVTANGQANIRLPSSWRFAALGELAEIRSGIQKQPKRTPRQNTYPYLRVANVLRGRLDLSVITQFELFPGELEAYRLLPGDLLVVEGNGSPDQIGRAALWNGEIPDCVHQNHIIRVRCVGIDPEFVELFWNSPTGAQRVAELAVTTAGLYSLSTKKIASVLIPIPPTDEQREIVVRAQRLLRLGESVASRLTDVRRTVDRCGQAALSTAMPQRDVVAAGWRQ